MAVLVFLALFLSFTSYSSAQYCLCKGGSTDPAPYQKVIDYACSAGASCQAIQQNGACYNPNDVKAHCDYAANSYYQNKKATGATCDFGGVAAPSSTPPTSLSTGCTFPTSGGSISTGGTPSTTSGGATTGGVTTGTTPGSGSLFPGGMGPTGGIPDSTPSGSLPLQQISGNPVLLSLTLFSGLLLLWG